MDPNCLFCKMVAGEIPINKIYEDDDFLAFLDIHPFSDGHTVLISKEHYSTVWKVKDIGAMMEVAQKLANNFIEKSDIKKVKSMIWEEDVSHAHIHLIPNATDEFLTNFHDFSQKVSGKLDPERAKTIVAKYKILE